MENGQMEGTMENGQTAEKAAIAKDLRQKAALLTENIGKRLIGRSGLIRKTVQVLLAGGHLLLEDVPGVGKTTLAKALADSVSCSFARIQCTPDTMPGDITGISVYRPADGTFEVLPGPVMHQIVLADELNRATPRTQAALLEAMEERQVTIDGKPFPLPEPFLVIGTQNPMEMAGTYPLPEAQLDRFMMRLSVGYPDSAGAKAMAEAFLEGALEEPVQPVLTAQDVTAMQRAVREVTVHDELVDYASRLVEATRRSADVRFGASPRALLELLRAAQASAFLEGRDYCTPADVRDSAKDVLRHRLMLTAEAKMNHISQESALVQIMGGVKAPV